MERTKGTFRVEEDGGSMTPDDAKEEYHHPVKIIIINPDCKVIDLGSFQSHEGLFTTVTLDICMKKNWYSNISLNIAVKSGEYKLPKVASSTKNPTLEIKEIHRYKFQFTNAELLPNLLIWNLPPTPPKEPDEDFAQSSWYENLYNRFATKTEATKTQSMREYGRLAIIDFDFYPRNVFIGNCLADQVQDIGRYSIIRDFFGPVFGESKDKVHRVVGFVHLKDLKQKQEKATKEESSVHQGYLARRLGDYKQRIQEERRADPMEAFFVSARNAGRMRPENLVKPGQRPAVHFEPERIFVSDRECFFPIGLALIQDEEIRRAHNIESRLMKAELRLLKTLKGSDRLYYGTLRLPHEYPSRPIYQSSSNVPSTRTQALKQGNPVHVLDLSTLKLPDEAATVRRYLKSGAFNVVTAKLEANDKTQKSYLNALEILNPMETRKDDEKAIAAHYRNFQLGHNIGKLPKVDIFKHIDVETEVTGITAALGIDLDEAQLQAIKVYCRELPDGIGILAGTWGAGKTHVNVVITMILLRAGQKVLISCASNDGADAIALRLKQAAELVFGINTKRIYRWHQSNSEKRYFRHATTINPEIREDRCWFFKESAAEELIVQKTVESMVERARHMPNGTPDKRLKLLQMTPTHAIIQETGLLPFLPSTKVSDGSSGPGLKPVSEDRPDTDDEGQHTESESDYESNVDEQGENFMRPKTKFKKVEMNKTAREALLAKFYANKPKAEQPPTNQKMLRS
ncbi:MAG: hypothetical protein M1819_002304 [Sarea resinae]|nr:MAG: hypothetical protein M1819_002304 [Sarea resinae]